MRLLLFAALLLSAVTGFAQPAAASDSLTVEGIALHDAGKYREAVRKFEQALRLNPNNTFAWYEMGNSYQALQEYQEALKCADKVIGGKGDLLAEAYALKGNTFDLMGKKEQAVQTYREGISRGKPSNMLHFNLGITLMGQEKYEEAATEFVNSLKIDFSHTSSHYGLGMAYSTTSSKVKTLLPLYYFLLLENKGQRAKTALKTIRNTAQTQLEKTSEGFIQINLPATSDDEFRTTETALALHAAAEDAKRETLKDSLGADLPEPGEVQRLVAYNELFFKMLGETTGRPADPFWWTSYADFFAALQANGHTEAFTYYLLLNGGDAGVREWLMANKPRLEAFSNWIMQYQNN